MYKKVTYLFESYYITQVALRRAKEILTSPSLRDTQTKTDKKHTHTLYLPAPVFSQSLSQTPYSSVPMRRAAYLISIAYKVLRRAWRV